MKTRNPGSSLWRQGQAALGLMALVACATASTTAAASQIEADVGIDANVSIDTFQDTLTPYGDWLEVGQFGRVWRPYQTIVGVDFRPYFTGGHWVYTDYGWTFESDYGWGWAPFHYGRWMLDAYYGWVWVPGAVWGPAWVDWRFGGGYVGWSPLAPVGFSIGFGFRPTWCFVPVTHFVVRNFHHYVLPVERFHWAYSVTSPIRQQVHYAGAQWNAGPPPGQVSQVVGHPIQPVSITPPRAGQIQPVRVGTPAAVAGATSNAGSPSGIHSPAAPPAGSASQNRTAVPPPGAVHSPAASGWGSPSVNSPNSAPAIQPHPGSAPQNRPAAPPPGAVHSSAASGWGSPSANSLSSAPASQPHWGRAPAEGAPHWGSRNTEGSNQSQPAPSAVQPSPGQGSPAGRASSGGFVPGPPPGGNQGYRSPQYQLNQSSPQFHAPAVRPYSPPQMQQPMRAGPPQGEYYSRSANVGRSYSAPAPVHSAPAAHYSAPAPHFSAPAPHFSAPAPHFSGGGAVAHAPAAHAAAAPAGRSHR